MKQHVFYTPTGGLVTATSRLLLWLQQDQQFLAEMAEEYASAEEPFCADSVQRQLIEDCELALATCQGE